MEEFFTQETYDFIAWQEIEMERMNEALIEAYDPYADFDGEYEDFSADAEALASAGHGSDEDYGFYGNEDVAFEAGLFGWEA